MAIADLGALRAAFAKKAEGSSENTGFWDKFYPFYKMDLDALAVFRFLPDLDDDNPLGFIIENVYHELTINGKKKKIACGRMHGDSCLLCELSKKHYDEGNTSLGKMFWKKRDYIAQGLVVSSPFEYEVKPDENPVRLISLGIKLYGRLEDSIVKGDLDAMPYDMANGYDFRILKKKQGEYADYTSSEFARKSTPISADLLERIELYSLKKFRFQKIERDQMELMAEAALTGKSYEEEKTADAPSGANTGSPALDAKLDAPKSVEPAKTVVEAAKAATPAAPAASGDTPKLSPAEILAKLRAQRAAS